MGAAVVDKGTRTQDEYSKQRKDVGNYETTDLHKLSHLSAAQSLVMCALLTVLEFRASLMRLSADLTSSKTTSVSEFLREFKWSCTFTQILSIIWKTKTNMKDLSGQETLKSNQVYVIYLSIYIAIYIAQFPAIGYLMNLFNRGMFRPYSLIHFQGPNIGP